MSAPLKRPPGLVEAYNKGRALPPGLWVAQEPMTADERAAWERGRAHAIAARQGKAVDPDAETAVIHAG